MNIEYISREGLEKVKKQLEHLKNVERPKVLKAIQEAREHGDLKENAEYKAAKEQQRILEEKIADLERRLSSIRVIDESEIKTEEVGLYSKVRVKNLKINKEQVFTIVGPLEANLKEGKISYETPIGRALLGKKVGDKVEVKVPAGILQFEIIKISK